MPHIFPVKTLYADLRKWKEEEKRGQKRKKRNFPFFLFGSTSITICSVLRGFFFGMSIRPR